MSRLVAGWLTDSTTTTKLVVVPSYVLNTNEVSSESASYTQHQQQSNSVVSKIVAVFHVT